MQPGFELLHEVVMWVGKQLLIQLLHQMVVVAEVLFLLLSGPGEGAVLGLSLQAEMEGAEWGW